MNTSSKAELKAKMYFTACMDPNNTIETLGAKPLLGLIKDIGGWNISGTWNVDTWKLQRTLETVHNRYNMVGLFNWMVGEDDRNSSRHVIQVSIQQNVQLVNQKFLIPFYFLIIHLFKF